MNYRILLISAFIIIVLGLLASATSNSVGNVDIQNIQAQNFTGTLGTDFPSSFQVHNSHSSDMMITFSETGLTGLDVVFSPSSRTVGAGETDTINFEIRTDPGDGAGNYTGTLRATANNTNYDFFDVNVELIRSSTTDMLIIESVSIENIGVQPNQIAESFKPDTPMDIEFDVRSLFTENNDPRIKDIQVKVKIEDIEDRGTDDIDMDAVDFNLDSRESKNLDEFEFRIPFDVEDNRVYDIIITAKGRDEESARHEAEFRTGLRTVKNQNDVRFTRLNIQPLTFKCGGTLTADIEVTNLGTSDEDEAVYTLKNEALGIFTREIFELKSDSNSDKFEYNKLHTFEIPADAAPGKYSILAKAYYESTSETDQEKIRFTVEQCDQQTTTEDEPEEGPEDEPEEEPLPTETEQETEDEPETSGQEQVSQPGQIESVDTGNLFDNKSFLILTIFIILGIALLIIYILYLVMF
jgi:hypothetical protein